MPRGHCKCGSNLYELLRSKSHDLIAADAEKRRLVVTASRAEWREVAQLAEEARMDFERGRCAYVEHVVSCKACEWDGLADSYLNSQPGMEYVANASTIPSMLSDTN